MFKFLRKSGAKNLKIDRMSNFNTISFSASTGIVAKPRGNFALNNDLSHASALLAAWEFDGTIGDNIPGFSNVTAEVAISTANLFFETSAHPDSGSYIELPSPHLVGVRKGETAPLSAELQAWMTDLDFGTGSFTAELILRFAETPDPNDQIFQMFPIDFSQVPLGISYLDGDNALRVQTPDADNHSASFPALNTMTHLIVGVDYENDLLIIDQDGVNVSTVASVEPTTGNIDLISLSDQTGIEISSLRIYNRVLTPGEKTLQFTNPYNIVNGN